MGAANSREEPSVPSVSSSSWSDAYAQSPYTQTPYAQETYARPPYGQQSQSYVPQQSFSSPQCYPPPENYHGGAAADNRKKFDRRYSRIADDYKSFEEVR